MLTTESSRLAATSATEIWLPAAALKT